MPGVVEWTAALALLCPFAGIAAALRSDDWGYAGGGLIVGANVPFTLLAIMPTNRRLLGAGGSLPDPEARALLVRWGRLHAVRVLLGGLGLAVLTSRMAP